MGMVLSLRTVSDWCCVGKTHEQTAGNQAHEHLPIASSIIIAHRTSGDDRACGRQTCKIFCRRSRVLRGQRIRFFFWVNSLRPEMGALAGRGMTEFRQESVLRDLPAKVLQNCYATPGVPSLYRNIPAGSPPGCTEGRSDRVKPGLVLLRR